MARTPKNVRRLCIRHNVDSSRPQTRWVIKFAVPLDPLNVQEPSMSTVTEIVHEWALARIVDEQAVLAGDPNREVASVQLLESLGRVEALPRGSMLLLTARASAEPPTRVTRRSS
jgi:hypothetical protein